MGEEKDIEPVSEREPAHPIAEAIKDYAESVNSLRQSLLLSMMIVQEANKVSQRQYDQFVTEHCAVKKDSDEDYVIVPIEHDARYNVLRRRSNRLRISRAIVPRTFLVSLVSEYDAYLGRLMAAIYRWRPELLNSSEHTLTYSQLSEFPSIDAAREHVLEKEIETLLRKSHAEQFESLEKRFGLPLRKDLPSWPTFIEVTERRNLFVHSGGIVSSQYLRVCREEHVRLDESISIGKKLDCPQSYFGIAHEALYEIGVKLGQVLWRKISPDDIADADSSLNDLTYDLINEKRYRLSTILLDFATTTLKKHADERNRLMFVVNRAQGYKWLGNSDMVSSILSGQDWSATSDAFRLAEAVLSDRFEDAAKIMKLIGNSGYPHKVQYRDWPLFQEFRKTEHFKNVYKELFNEDFDTERIEKSRESTVDVVEELDADANASKRLIQ